MAYICNVYIEDIAVVSSFDRDRVVKVLCCLPVDRYGNELAAVDPVLERRLWRESVRLFTYWRRELAGEGILLDGVVDDFPFVVVHPDAVLGEGDEIEAGLCVSCFDEFRIYL